MVEYGHHAQNDRWAIEAVFPQKRGGFFVEAGACAGLQGARATCSSASSAGTASASSPIDRYYEILCERRSCLKDPRCLSGRTGDVVEFLVVPRRPAPQRHPLAEQEHGAPGGRRGIVGRASRTRPA